MTLTEFLNARLDDDQRQAQSLMRLAQDTQLTFEDPKWLGRPAPGWHGWRDVEKQSAHVLADVTAKRAILTEHAPYGKRGDEDCSTCGDVPQVEYPCRTVLLLAQPYADHADFDASWRMAP